MKKENQDAMDLDVLLDDLKKSFGESGEDNVQKAKKTKKAKKEEYDEDMLDDEGEEEDEDEDLEKSIDDDLFEETATIDVTDQIDDIHKSITVLRKENALLRKSLSDIAASISGMTSMVKSLGGGVLANSEMMKSISGLPIPRKTGNLSIEKRFGKSKDDLIAMSEIKGSEGVNRIIKSMNDLGLDGNVRADVNMTFRRHGALGVYQKYPNVIENIIGKE